MLEPKYDEANIFFESRAGVRKGEKWAIFGADSGEIHQMSDFIFDDISIYKDGMAVVTLGKVQKFVDLDSRIMTDDFYLANPFSSDLASVCK